MVPAADSADSRVDRAHGSDFADLTRWMAKFQAFLFFPLLLESLELHRSGIRSVWRGEVRLRGLEKALLIPNMPRHVIPDMPRRDLRRAQPIVRGFGAERGIGYRQCGQSHPYGQVPRHLAAVGALLRAAPR
ncbi:MAG TPA: hypothetical protein VG756_17815 [Pseudonocardiaceae bacterium]|jgi:hypothetical protein|nr:hypothetical protein [Pseudonocardiaceae bacterium]